MKENWSNKSQRSDPKTRRQYLRNSHTGRFIRHCVMRGVDHCAVLLLTCQTPQTIGLRLRYWEKSNELIDRLKLAREVKSTALDGKLFQISITRSDKNDELAVHEPVSYCPVIELNRPDKQTYHTHRNNRQTVPITAVFP